VAVEKAKHRVKSWLEKVQNPYVAFSTGKDSTCVLHLVREQAPWIPAVYFDADAAFPESLDLLATIDNVIIFPTLEPILNIFRRHSFSDGNELENETLRMCTPVKELIARYHFDGIAYGLRAEENRGRAMHAQTRGAVFQYRRDGLWGCQPIYDWTFNDVWAYILSQGINYCAVYDKLMKLGVPPEDCRLSYWAGETKRRWGRWAILKRGWPELFNRFAAEFPEIRSYI
jgi:3'-phosphoadenosine 5'-phosphosulfate sulfotransferase (PAPS reductase)/FAD synthetase